MTAANSAQAISTHHNSTVPIYSRFLGNLWRSPSRFFRSASRWFSGAYEWESRAAYDLAQWFPPQDQAILSSICGTGHRTIDRMMAWLAAQAPPTGCLVDIGSQGTYSAAWMAMGAMRHPSPLTVVSIGEEIDRVWQVFARQAESAHLQSIVDQTFSDVYSPVVAPLSNSLSSPSPIPVSRILDRLRLQNIHPLAACSSFRDPISMLSVHSSRSSHELITLLHKFVPHVAPSGWIAWTGIQGKRGLRRQALIHQEMAAHKDCTHVITIRSLILYRRQAN